MTMDALRWIARGVCLPEIILPEVRLEVHCNKAIQTNVEDHRLQGQAIADHLVRTAITIQDTMIGVLIVKRRLYRP